MWFREKKLIQLESINNKNKSDNKIGSADLKDVVLGLAVGGVLLLVFHFFLQFSPILRGREVFVEQLLERGEIAVEVLNDLWRKIGQHLTLHAAQNERQDLGEKGRRGRRRTRRGSWR